MATTRKAIIPLERIAQTIVGLRGQKVLLDADLAQLYGVTTGNLNKAVGRNRDRFPKDFMFRLSCEEAANLRFQIGISSWGGRRALPHAFTEQGVAMLSSVLKSERARKFAELETRVIGHDKQIAGIMDAIRRLMAPPQKPKREIGFHVRETAARYRTRKV